MLGGKLAFLIMTSTLVMIQERCSVTAELPIQHGVNFVGIGYNIIEGNPEGGDLSTGGVDPGLLLSRRIFAFTFDEGEKTSDQKNRIPDEVSFVRRKSVFTTSSLTSFYGTESYASKLSAQIEVSAGYEGFTAGVQFAASACYERVASKTSSEGSVFLSNETITNLGHARYEIELASAGKQLFSTSFVVKACRLPATFTDKTKNEYMEFMDKWGTHIVTEVALGIKEGENFEEQRSSFVSYAAQNVGGSVSASGSYGGFSASVAVDMESFNSAMESETHFGTSYSKYKIGSETLNEPISVKLIAMPEVFEPDYWTGLDDYVTAGYCSASFDRKAVKENMDNALRGYGEWHKIEKSTNPNIRTPLTWPDGVYGLPMPFNGCPTNDWNQGHRIHVTTTRGDTSRSATSNYKIFKGWVVSMISRQEFCMKTVDTASSSRWHWQPGSYCIYQYGSRCPDGFTSGNINWAELNRYSDLSVNYGVVPDGTYGSDTEINFCCRNDGVVSKSIYLPTDHSFMLFARFDNCQMVNGMSVKKETIFWDTEEISTQSEVHPADGVYNGGVRLIYCYYHVGDIEYPPDLEHLRAVGFQNDIQDLSRRLCDRLPEEC